MNKPSNFIVTLVTGSLTACTMPNSGHLSSGGPAGISFIRRLGQIARFGEWTMTLAAVLEDSRCPRNVRCIQAGTVRLRVALRNAARSRTGEVALGRPMAVGHSWLHLVGVCPARVAPVERPARASYRFQFTVSPDANPPMAPPLCA